LGWVLGRVLYMNNNTNHNFSDHFNREAFQPSHSACAVCDFFSNDAYECEEDSETTMTICEECYEEVLAFETKFAKVLGTVKI